MAPTTTAKAQAVASSSSSKAEDKVKKDKKDKKDKDKDKDKKDKDKKKSDKDSKDKKDKEKDKDKEKKSKKDKPKDDKPQPPPQPKPKPKPQARIVKKKEEDFYAGMDLPSSESSGDEREQVQRQDKEIVIHTFTSAKEQRKRDKKDKEAQEAQERLKQMALREDDETAISVVLSSGSSRAVDPNSRDVKVERFSVSARGKDLLVNADLTVAHGRRYGLVGPNGKGKSTLMKLIAKRRVPIPEHIDVLLVEQEVIGDERTALEAVVSADVKLMKLTEEEARLTKIAQEAEEKDGGESVTVEDDEGKMIDIGVRLGQIYDQLTEINAASAEGRAAKILSGLGFTPAMQGRATKTFSGGWRMRISLARALFIQPTLLLLDEPTNHLDLRAVLWLDEYLQKWKKTLIVVSHDRDFLNTVTTDIIHLHDLKLYFYRGNFDSFEDMYEQKRREVNKAYEKYEKQMRAAKQSGDKGKQTKVDEKAKQQQKRKAKNKRGIDDDDDDGAGGEEGNMIRKWNDYVVSFHFPQPSELAPPLLQLLDVEFQYPGREDFALKEINVGIDMGTRVAIVGPNGAGKSTLLNLLAGDIEPVKGQWRRSPKLRIGRYSQHFVDVLTMDETPVSYLLSLYPDVEGLSKQEAVRAKLGKFGLVSHNHLAPIAKLSGGQKARVVFASIAFSSPHILLLDEPTNNLDMQSIDALADAIEQFEGGVVLVSHDARLIERVCSDTTQSEIWIVDHGTVTTYDGDFDDFRQELLDEIRKEQEED